MRPFLLFLVLAALSVTAYAGLSAIDGQAGFPLDDAWIHQTYARNLAETGQMAYTPGELSAGSTSPLWTLLLSAGYTLKIDHRVWAYALGAVLLAACAWGVYRLSLRLWPDRSRLALIAGLLSVFEWHLGWAAASGMETLLFAALALALIEWTLRKDRRARAGAIFGALGGLLTVTRPEGLLLVGLCALTRLFLDRTGSPDGASRETRTERPEVFYFAVMAGFLVPVLPAAWLNLQAGGAIFPNTFYAKQQEYAATFASLSVWLPHAIGVIGAPFAGAQVLLLPGFVFQSFGLRDRSMRLYALPLAWIAAHLAVYAARLPVVYQHGRYLMPLVPLIILIGLHGSARWLARIRYGQVSRTARLAGLGSLIGVTTAFGIAGAGAYRVDVNLIENELVASARWIEAHTPPDALIAAHDIGAIGYFARRPLLDLAGLVSPEVIPIIRDEAALLNLMRARGADYFAAPPGFYATLPDAPAWAERVFVGTSPFAPEHWVILRAASK